MNNTSNCLQYWVEYEPLFAKHPVKRLENLESNCEPIKLLLLTLEIHTKKNSLIDYFVSYQSICICAFQIMVSAQTKQCHHMISAPLICAQHEIRLVLF